MKTKKRFSSRYPAAWMVLGSLLLCEAYGVSATFIKARPVEGAFAIPVTNQGSGICTWTREPDICTNEGVTDPTALCATALGHHKYWTSAFINNTCSTNRTPSGSVLVNHASDVSLPPP
jgi:hypothetical protein